MAPTDTVSPTFRRAELAERIAKQVLAKTVGSASSSGLFLAAPRRTGKSTFMREDLRPALESHGAHVLYVDLWANKATDPGDLIVNAVRSALVDHEGVITRLARKAGMNEVAVGGLSFSLDKVGLGSSVSLSEALSELSDQIKKPIVLIIDEAQHAITSDKGYEALFALKAARDELNSSKHFGLRIVATGSNRDKLAMLRNSKDQAFFAAPLVPFPPLDLEFVKWFCDGVGLPAPLDPVQVNILFARASNRPEILSAAADEVRFDFEIRPDEVAQKFDKAVIAQIEASDMQTLRVINGLTPLQSAVLRVMAARQGEFAPYQEETLNAYAAVLGDIAPHDPVKPDGSNVQQALIALQEKTLVWKETRGVYAIEENSTIELMRDKGMLDAVPDLEKFPRER